MLEQIQGTPTASYIYYAFHVLGFICVFLFNAWYSKKRNISIPKSTITTILVYGATYAWIYIQFWIESGFTAFGGNNIVKGFVYVPLFIYPVAKLLKIRFATMCDIIAPCVCIVHGISHWGCIFAGCCYGYPSNWGIYNIQYDRKAFPVQIFEALTALIIVAILVYWAKKNKYETTGKAYPVMMIMFGTTRFLWEFARNNYKIWLGCSSLAFHALFMALVGGIVLLVMYYRGRRKVRVDENL